MAEKHTHTPGPWVVEFDAFDDALRITSQDRLERGMVEIAAVSIGYADAFETEQQANARLIAQAPAMLAVLEQIVAATDPDDPESYRSDDREGCLDTVHAIALSAVRAATGEAP